MPSVKIASSSDDGPRRHIQGIASKPEDVKLRGESFTANVTDQIVGEGIQLNRTIEGASTLTIPLLDDSGDLRVHPLFQSRFELELDGLRFVFVAKEKGDDDTLTLTLEAKNVWRLRQHSGPEKAYRDKVTRAEFWVGLVKTLHPEIPVFCPQLHKVQPIKSDAQARADQPANDERRGGGLNEDAKLTVKGLAATAEQIKNGDTILRVGASLDAPEDAMVACIMAAIDENNLTNVNHGGDCLNIFCATTAAMGVVNAAGVDVSDVAGNAHIMYTTGYWHAGLIDSVNAGLSLGMACQEAEGSGTPDGSNYAAFESEAREWVAAFGGGTLKGGAGSTTVSETKRYPFTIAANETWWTGGQRLFSEVNWRLFEAAGLIYVIAEPRLLDSRVRMTVREGAKGIDSITWNQDVGKKLDELAFTGRAANMAAPPGSVCEVKGQGESVDGLYIVSNIQSFLSNEDVTVTLKRPTKPLPEPAAETTTKTVGGSSASVASGDAPEEIQRVEADIDRLSKLGLSYVFGGGHSTPAPANGPFDCSSFVSRETQLLDPGAPTMATGQLASYGEEGKGKWFTLYVHNGGPGGGHTLLEVNGRFAECGGSDNPDPNGGPSWIEPSAGRLAGFESVRHPPGF